MYFTFIKTVKYSAHSIYVFGTINTQRTAEFTKHYPASYNNHSRMRLTQELQK